MPAALSACHTKCMRTSPSAHVCTHLHLRSHFRSIVAQPMAQRNGPSHASSASSRNHAAYARFADDELKNAEHANMMPVPPSDRSRSPRMHACNSGIHHERFQHGTYSDTGAASHYLVGDTSTAARAYRLCHAMSRSVVQSFTQPWHRMTRDAINTFADAP